MTIKPNALEKLISATRSTYPRSIQKNLCFASANFNRQSLKRNDKQWFAQQLADQSSQFLLFWDNKFLTTDDFNIRFLDKTTTEQFSSSTFEWKYLGEIDVTESGMIVPVTIFGAEIINATKLAEQAKWQSLRTIGLHLTAHDANLLAYTQGLLNWHSINRYCSHCGSTVLENQGGHALVCSNIVCAKEIFPRTDPAVIVLIFHQDACLLGRAASWPEGMYSCLAGFVETGEDLDAAVRRETFEEAGLVLNKITYRGSQPWPFPQSIMLGFHAEATTRDLTFHDGEIEDARWFTRQQLLDAIAENEVKLSSSLSISYHLLEDWFNQQSDVSLSKLLNR